MSASLVKISERETKPDYVKYKDSKSFRKDYDEWRKKNAFMPNTIGAVSAGI